jgi:hypothetical protein
MVGPKPTMFIGSSVEGKRVAEQIQESLEYEVESTVWHQGVFGLSGGTLETLVNALDDYDFATLVLTADDLIEKREVSGRSPRDNVLFELGLFMGALGRCRTFIVHSRTRPPLLPSDLAGITPATYEERANLGAALGPACGKLRRAIEAEGVRDKPVLPASRDTEIPELHRILSEQHKMVSELFRVITNDARQPAGGGVDLPLQFLEGAWLSSSGSHGYCAIEPAGPRMVYCWEGDSEAIGEYYDFRRIGDDIFGRFRWFDNHIFGFTWLKIESPARLSGAWWMADAVPLTGLDDPEQLKQLRGGNTYSWTKQPDAKYPAWATAALRNRPAFNRR